MWPLLLILLFPGCCLGGNTYRVGSSLSGSFSSISEAIRAANRGDVVEISAGTYSGYSNCDLIINSDKDGISLVGVSGSQNTIVDCKGYGSRCLSVLDASVKLTGISFRNGQAPGVLLSRKISSSANDDNEIRNDDEHKEKEIKFRNLPRKPFAAAAMVLRIPIVLTPDGEFIHKKYDRRNKKIKKKIEEDIVQLNSLNVPASSLAASFYSQSVGGCVLIINSASTSMQDIVIQGGTALNGGGLYIMQATSVILASTSVINNAIYANYTTQNLYGGGGFISNCSSLKMSSTSFSNNSMTLNYGGGYLNGGGLYAFSSSISMNGPMYFNANRLSSGTDSKQYGGGLFLDTCNGASIFGPFYVCKTAIRSIGHTYGGGVYFANCLQSTVVGPVEMTENNIYSATATIHSGGIDYFFSDGAVLIGPILFANNYLAAAGTGSVYSGGLEVYSTNNITVKGPMTIRDNYLSGTGKTTLVGGGIYFRNSLGSSLTGPILIQNNTIVSLAPQMTLTVPYVPPPRAANSKCGALTISKTSGIINDGSLGSYSPNLACSWLIALSSSVDQAMAKFNITMLQFDTEPAQDWLYLYDGPTSQAPLLGRYSGSLNNAQCVSGTCSPLTSPIYTSVGALFIMFTSNVNTQLTGFTLQWTTSINTKTNGTTQPLLDSPLSYPISALGGGMAIISTDITIRNVVLIGNSVAHPWCSHGGGIFAQTSTVRIFDSIFQGNSVNSLVAAGGAIVAVSQSQVQCTGCTFVDNSAVGVGNQCFYSTALQDVVCGSVFGGSVVVLSGSTMTIQSSTFARDKCICAAPSIDCAVHGASMSVTQTGSVLNVISSTFNSAQLICLSPPLMTVPYACTWAVGGNAFVDSASMIVLNSVFKDSVATGASVGGGIFGTGAASISLVNTIIMNSTAAQGGGLGLEGFSRTTMKNASLVENTALSVGGGALVVETASIAFYDSSFVNNRAPKASVIFSYNEDNTATYTTQGISVTTPPGISSLMIGEINFTSTVNSWKCTWPGTVFSQDLAGNFFSLSCDRCTEGTYAIGAASSATMNRTCQPCPFGSVCNGSSPTSNGLLALGGYWGNVNDQGGVSFYACPFGYCCPLQETCEHAYCQGGRIGRLCGQCPAGQGLRFFTEGCGDDSTCNDAGWAAIAIIVGAIVFVMVMTFTDDSDISDAVSVLLYFYQVLPLIKGSPWKYTIPSLIIALQSIFAMTPSSGESNQQGVCIQKSMAAYQKLGYQMLMQGVVMATLVFIYLVHILIKKFTDIPKIPAVKGSQYLAGAVRLGVIAYITLVLVPLQMIQCIWMSEEGKRVWWWDASIECYQGWQIGGFVAIVVLLPVPLLLIILLWKFWVSDTELQEEWQQEVWKVLTREYRHKRRWWLGISLYRRFLLAVVFATITDANWRGIATMLLCLVFIVLNITSHPFKSPITQRAETISLMILGAISATAAPQLSQLQFRTRYGISNEVALESVQFILAVLPALAFIWVLLQHVSLLKTKFFQHRGAQQISSLHGYSNGKEYSSLKDKEGVQSPSLPSTTTPSPPPSPPLLPTATAAAVLPTTLHSDVYKDAEGNETALC